jgi:hypothetical protein
MVEPIDGHGKPRLPQTHSLDSIISADADLFAEQQEKIFAKIRKFEPRSPSAKSASGSKGAWPLTGDACN